MQLANPTERRLPSGLPRANEERPIHHTLAYCAIAMSLFGGEGTHLNRVSFFIFSSFQVVVSRLI
jgi:hypothetical protein